MATVGRPEPTDRRHGGEKAVEVAVEDGAGVRGFDAGAQILDHLIALQHVGADLVTPADVGLRRVHRVGRRLEPLQFGLIEPRAEHREGVGAVVVLRALALALHDDAARHVGDAHHAVGLVEPVGKSARRYSEQMLRLGGLHQFIEEIRMSEAHQCVDALSR